MRWTHWLAALFLCFPALQPAGAEDFFFKDGDKVVMIGDSITEQHLYSNYVEMWTTTRFPAWKLTFRNVGIGGDRSTGGNGRFQRDVVFFKPTAMTVDFGMNDGNYRGFEEPTFKVYVDGLQGMADQAKAAGIRAAWCTPQPLDGPEQGPTALTGYNQTLEKYSEGVKTIAEKNGGLFVDQFHPYLAVLDKARGAGPNYPRITAGDAVHPGPPGQALMAASILKGLHFPALVSSVEIDAAARKGTGQNAEVTDVVAKDGGVSFQRLDRALPFFPAQAMSILQWAPLLEELNQYTLKVTGLKAGKYDVRLGGSEAGSYTADELAAGVNLAAAALKAGPVAEQVKGIVGAIERKNGFHHDRIFRGVILNGNVPDWIGLTPAEIEAKRQSVLKERHAELEKLDGAVRETLTIKPHQVEIVPAK